MDAPATAPPPEPGSLSWRLSSHPLTLLSFLGFRLAPLLVYLFGLLFIDNYVLIFILTTLLLAVDFYTCKNIAGRRLVGLRWWNEATPSTGESTMVFESLDEAQARDRGGINPTDKRFFWLAMYVQPVFWILLGVVALVKLHALWLTLVVIALVLTITNTVAFSRCDKFGQASNLASSAIYSGGIARNVATGMISRFFTR